MNFISLFSGCGGFDLGFINSGFKCLGAYDNDPNAILNYKNNIGDWIENVDLEIINGRELVKNSCNVDLVISGSPCQGYSTLGKRKLNDPRNNLLVKGGEIAIDLKTRFFVAENVVGSTYGEHAKYWYTLKKILHKAGYRTKIEIIDSYLHGLAQTRKRVFLFAWKGKNRFKFTPILTEKQKILGDVIKNINGANNHIFDQIEKNDPRIYICNAIKQDQKLCDVRGGKRAIHSWQIPEFFGQCSKSEIELLLFIKEKRRQIRKRSFGDADPLDYTIIKESFGDNTDKILQSLLDKNYICEKGKDQFDLKRSYNGKFRRLAWNKPSLTVDTNFGNPNYFLHPEENRGLSVREIARIQGFDDNYIFYGSFKQQINLIGNAVPPPISNILAKEIGKYLCHSDGK